MRKINILLYRNFNNVVRPFKVAILLSALLPFFLEAPLIGSSVKVESASDGVVCNVENPPLDIEKKYGFDFIKAAGCRTEHKQGFPRLPVKNILVALPCGAGVKEIKILELEKELLEGSFKIP
ncbi:MAG: hypothetical protein COT16_02845, partial [Elusimicrobia bacterium CG08_land_8_20_14_0_20_44_26]